MLGDQMRKGSSERSASLILRALGQGGCRAGVWTGAILNLFLVHRLHQVADIIAWGVLSRAAAHPVLGLRLS